jgi:hypothetical protein
MLPDARDDPVDHVLLLHPPHHIGHLQLVVQPLLHLHAGGRPTLYTILQLQAGGEQRFTHHFQVRKYVILTNTIRFICPGFFRLDYVQIF